MVVQQAAATTAAAVVHQSAASTGMTVAATASAVPAVHIQSACYSEKCSADPGNPCTAPTVVAGRHNHPSAAQSAVHTAIVVAGRESQCIAAKVVVAVAGRIRRAAAADSERRILRSQTAAGPAEDHGQSCRRPETNCSANTSCVSLFRRRRAEICSGWRGNGKM